MQFLFNYVSLWSTKIFFLNLLSKLEFLKCNNIIELKNKNVAWLPKRSTFWNIFIRISCIHKHYFKISLCFNRFTSSFSPCISGSRSKSSIHPLIKHNIFTSSLLFKLLNESKGHPKVGGGRFENKWIFVGHLKKGIKYSI